MNVNETDRRWIAWLIAVALIVVGTVLGIQFPKLPPTPDGYSPQFHAGQYTNLSGLVVSGPTTFATATPAAIVDSAGLGNILEIRDATTPIAYYANGGSYTANQGQTANNWVKVAGPTAIATATPVLVVDSSGLSQIVSFRDGGTELLGVRNGGGVAVAAPTAIATAQPALVVDSSGGLSNIFEVRDSATPMWYVNNTGGWYAGGNGYSDGRITIANVGIVSAPTAVATATPAWVVDSLALSNILEVRDAATPVAQFRNGGGLDLIANPIVQDIGTENQGVLPSVVSTDITYTAAAGGTGAVATIADGEIWIVHDVYVRVTTNFDCTGDDATLVIGDGNDADGFCVLADAELQAADTEGTGWAAGWQCQVAATIGVYGDENDGFIYAPSGAAETIDWLVDEADGETLSAGAATVYVVYTRIQ